MKSKEVVTMKTALQSFRARLSGLSGPQKTVAAVVCALLVLLLLFAAVNMTPSARLSRQLELGQRYLTELDYEAAVLEFTKAIHIDARSEPAYMGRAEAYLGLGEYQLAVDDYTVVIEELNPENAQAYAGRSQAYTGLGDAERAAADAARADELGGGQTADEQAPQTTAVPSDTPLTAADLQWTLEPTYDYAQVLPLRGNAFSDMEGPYSNGTQSLLPDSTFYEMSFPGYSNLPQYYGVQLSDGTWKYYYMPDHADSGDILLSPLNGAIFSTEGFRYDAYGIVNYYQMDQFGYLPLNAKPWYVFTSLDRGGGSMDLYYDSASQMSLAIGDFYGLYTSPVSDCGLHKPYPCRQINLQDLGLDLSTPQSFSLDGVISEQHDRFYDLKQETLSPLYAYVGTDGQLITDFSYELAEDFSEGLAACSKDGKWGYIDENGQTVIDFVYDGVWYNSFYDQNAGEYGAYVEGNFTAYPCTSDTIVVSQNGQYGLLYRDGTLLIGFGELEAMAPAYNDELWAKKDGLWGLVDLAAVKEKMGLDPTLSAPAPAEVPDPPTDNVERIAALQTGDVLIDYPTVTSEESLIPTETFITTADSGLVMRTGPGTGYQRKGSIPAGSFVAVQGALRSTPGWVYVSWYDQQSAQTVYGWVSQEYLQKPSYQ